MLLSDEEKQLIAGFRAGKSIICNVTFGLGIKATEDDSGRISIEVEPRPDIKPGYEALAAFVASTAETWQQAVQDRKAA